MIAPRIPLVRDGQILSVGLVNSLIGRTEYVAQLLQQYKLIAGNEMYVEPHFDGTRVSYLQPVAGGALPKINPKRGISVVTLRCSAMDIGEILTWSISGTVSSANLFPFTGQSQTRARMSGRTITSVEPVGTDARFIVVINGSNLNNFSIVKSGASLNGSIIDVTFQKTDGTSFKFSNFCGTEESPIGQGEAFGTCRFYDGGVGGGPPGIPFQGVGNYWLINSGESMTFSVKE